MCNRLPPAKSFNPFAVIWSPSLFSHHTRALGETGVGSYDAPLPPNQCWCDLVPVSYFVQLISKHWLGGRGGGNWYRPNTFGHDCSIVGWTAPFSYTMGLTAWKPPFTYGSIPTVGLPPGLPWTFNSSSALHGGHLTWNQARPMGHLTICKKLVSGRMLKDFVISGCTFALKDAFVAILCKHQ